MERLPAEILGEAVERIICQCQSLDKDRKELAHALTRLQGEFVLLREENGKMVSENSRLREKLAQLESIVETAVARLEQIVANCEEGACSTSAPPVGNESESKPALENDLAEQKSSDKTELAGRVVKELDLNSFTRIVRQAGGTIETEHSDSVEDKTDVQLTPEASECIRDRLF